MSTTAAEHYNTVETGRWRLVEADAKRGPHIRYWGIESVLGPSGPDQMRARGAAHSAGWRVTGEWSCTEQGQSDVFYQGLARV